MFQLPHGFWSDVENYSGLEEEVLVLFRILRLVFNILLWKNGWLIDCNRCSATKGDGRSHLLFDSSSSYRTICSIQLSWQVGMFNYLFWIGQHCCCWWALSLLYHCKSHHHLASWIVETFFLILLRIKCRSELNW